MTSTIEMAVVYRSEPDNFANVCLKPLGVLSSVCVCVLASEMSIREDCPGQCSSQRATSGTLCFVLWSSTWILTGRRRCYWEHMARSQLLFTDAPSNLLTLSRLLLHLMKRMVTVCCTFWSVGTSLLQIPTSGE